LKLFRFRVEIDLVSVSRKVWWWRRWWR